MILDDKGRSKGFAFVEFETEDDARAALAANNHELKKRRMAVTLADSRVRPKNKYVHRFRTCIVTNVRRLTLSTELLDTVRKCGIDPYACAIFPRTLRRACYSRRWRSMRKSSAWKSSRISMRRISNLRTQQYVYTPYPILTLN